MVDDGDRGRSVVQFGIDSLALTTLVGAGNGLVVGAALYGVIGAIFGAIYGLVVALILWLPATCIARWLTTRHWANRLSGRRFVVAMRGVGATFGVAPSLYFVVWVESDLTWNASLALVAVALLGLLSGLWAGSRLAKLQLSRTGIPSEDFAP